MKFKIIVTTLVLQVIILSGIGYWFYKSEVQSHEKIFKTNFLYRIEKYRIKIENALKNADDLALISYVKELPTLKNIEYAFVLNTSSKVLAHSRVEEIGKIYKSKFTKKTLKVKKTTFFPRKSKKFNLYDLSIPLWKGAEKIGTLRIGIIYSSLIKKQKELKQTLISIGAIILILFFIIEFSLLTSQINPVLKNINLLLEKLNMQQFDEEFKINKKGKIFKNIEKNINAIKEHLKKIASIENKDIFLENSKKIIESIAPFIDRGFIFINTENIITFANNKVKELLNTENIENQHIFDCFKEDILPLFEEAIKNSDEKIEKNIEDKTISIRHIKDIGFFLFIEST